MKSIIFYLIFLLSHGESAIPFAKAAGGNNDGGISGAHAVVTGEIVGYDDLALTFDTSNWGTLSVTNSITGTILCLAAGVYNTDGTPYPTSAITLQKCNPFDYFQQFMYERATGRFKYIGPGYVNLDDPINSARGCLIPDYEDKYIVEGGCYSSHTTAASLVSAGLEKLQYSIVEESGCTPVNGIACIDNGNAMIKNDGNHFCWATRADTSAPYTYGVVEGYNLVLKSDCSGEDYMRFTHQSRDGSDFLRNCLAAFETKGITWAQSDNSLKTDNFGARGYNIDNQLLFGGLFGLMLLINIIICCGVFYKNIFQNNPKYQIVNQDSEVENIL